MGYDFDTPVVRRGSGCMKWDELPADDVLPMWVADMDFRTAPVVEQALQRRVAHGVFGYTMVPEAYYEAVIGWFRRRHGWAIERPWIQYTSGVVPALSCIVKAFTQPGDRVVVQTPVYNCFFSSIRNNGCEVVESPLQYNYPHYTMDFDDLSRQTAHPRTRLLVLCNPHNPASRVWTRQELQRVAHICRRNGVIVVSDEIHNELVYHGRYQPFGTVDMDNAIVCTSPSKSFNTAGLQIANIVCSHPEWQQRIDRAINDNEVCDVNPFGVEALMAAYNEGEPWLDALCAYIHGNYEALCQYVAQHLPAIRVLPLEGTYLAWLDVKALGQGSDALTQRLLHEGRVLVSSGTLYGKTAGEGFLRLNLACPRAQLMDALNRMRRVLG